VEAFVKRKSFFTMAAVAVLAALMAAAEGRPMAMNTHAKNVKTADAASPPWLKHGVSREAYNDFQSFWEEFEARPHYGDFAIPRVIVWLSGAPGAGKGTFSGDIADVYGIKEAPVVASDLLNSTPEFIRMKDSGKLLPDRDVTAIVFNAILTKQYADGVIVDGYPRTSGQAECMRLLRDKIMSLRQKCDFQMVILDVSEEVSVERQLGRGIQAKRHNERVLSTGEGTIIQVRKTDEDPEAARGRFKTFQEQTADALSVLQKQLVCHRINAEGSFEHVRSRVVNTLRENVNNRGKQRYQ
jgi:adenylate kinase